MNYQDKSLSFDKAEKRAIEDGGLKRQLLKKKVKKVVSKLSSDSLFPHCYIVGDSGLGKTHNVNEELKSCDLQHYEVSGNVSMFKFGVQLAQIAFENRDNDDIQIISVDDCDELLKNGFNMNIMKDVLDCKNGKYVYNKALQSQILHLNPKENEAITNFMPEGTSGFIVPTTKMRFVITSNQPLATESHVSSAREKHNNRAFYLAHQHAIRERVDYYDINSNFTQEEKWGWIADAILTEKVDGLSHLNKKEQIFILKWMKSKWKSLTDKSIRVAQKLAEIYDEDVDNCEENWSFQFLERKEELF